MRPAAVLLTLARSDCSKPPALLYIEIALHAAPSSVLTDDGEVTYDGFSVLELVPRSDPELRWLQVILLSRTARDSLLSPGPGLLLPD